VGPDAEQGQLAVLGLGEGLAAETREGGKAERGLDVVEVHVRKPLGHRVGARPHPLVGDRLQADLLARIADRDVEAGERAAQILVDPPVGERALAAGLAHPRREAPADEGHLGERARTMRGPCSRYRAGSRSCHTWGGSTVWSSTEMIQGKLSMRVRVRAT
jgi:hypothetical protein